VPETTVKKGSDYPVGPLVLGFFVFVVIGSCTAFQPSLNISFQNLFLQYCVSSACTLALLISCFFLSFENIIDMVSFSPLPISIIP
jgi:hypothetical protein